MQDLLEILTLAYKKLSAQNIVLFLLLIKIAFCAIGGLIVTYIHSKFSYKWLRNNFNIYVGITLPVIGLVITTVIGSNIALSIGMIGALSIVRFRNPVRSPFELAVYFLAISLGIVASVSDRWLGFFVVSIIMATLSLCLVNYIYQYFVHSDTVSVPQKLKEVNMDNLDLYLVLDLKHVPPND